MADVIGGIVRRQGRQGEGEDDALVELAQLSGIEEPVEFGLAEEHDLHQLDLIGLQVRQPPHGLEAADAQRLGLVDDQHHPAVGGVLLEQIAVEQMEAVVGALRIEAELPAHRADDPLGIGLGIDDVGDRLGLDQLGGQQAAQQGLAGADLAADLDHPLAALDGVEHRGQHVLMAIAGVIEPRVGGQRERAFFQTEMSEERHGRQGPGLFRRAARE